MSLRSHPSSWAVLEGPGHLLVVSRFCLEHETAQTNVRKCEMPDNFGFGFGVLFPPISNRFKAPGDHEESCSSYEDPKIWHMTPDLN